MVSYGLMGFYGIYPLVMTNVAIAAIGPVEMVSFHISMVDLSHQFFVKVYQRVGCVKENRGDETMRQSRHGK